MKAILPVAGNGTRMYPLGLTTPKALIRILNKPLIDWTLEALVQNGIDEVVIVTSAGKFGTMIKEYMENEVIATNRYPLDIHLTRQEQQLGTGHVVQMAKDFIKPGEEFIFCYGDDLYGPGNIKAVVSADGLAVVGKEVNDPEKWGIFQGNAQGNLEKVVEKPQEFVGNLANIGCMKLNSRLFELYEKIAISVRGEYEITDTLQLLATEQPIKVIAAPDYWIPIGYPWHILEATEHFLPLQTDRVEGEIHPSVVRSGTLVLPQSSKILAGCYIDGNILVGENVVVGPNARLRGNVVLGDDSTIGFGVDVSDSVIGENSEISRLSFVGDSVIGDRCVISAGTMISNGRHDGHEVSTPIKGQMITTGRAHFGAVLGDGVRLGINTSVYPGRKIWPHLFTRPGQVVDKDLTE